MLKDILRIGLKKILWLKKLKTLFHRHVISEINGEKIIGIFCKKKNCIKTNHKEFRIEKVIKKKGNKLYVKWKGYDNLSNSGIDKKGVV